MSDLSHMSTADLKSEQIQLTADEKAASQLLEAIKSITSKFAAIETNAIASTGLMVFLFLGTCLVIGIGYLALGRLPAIASVWTISWLILTAFMILASIGARRQLDHAMRVIAEASAKELPSLKQCEETLTVLQRKTFNVFTGNMLLAVVSIVLIIIAIVAS